MEQKKYFEIGKIVNTQGVKGDVRVLPTTFNEKRFELLSEVELVLKNGTRTLEIEKVWYHKQFVILKLKGIDDMDAGEKLKNTIIRISAENALPLEENEYYIQDLYGMKVVTVDGEELGSLKDIIETGANDVYVVKNSDTEILIPAIKQCIINVNINEKTMTVKLLEGLR